MLADASYFASGKKLEISRTDPKDALGDALEYLIQNAYPKMGYIQHLHPNPKQEIQSILRANDVEQVSLGLETPEANPQALDDLREYIRLCAMTSKQIVLHELIEKKLRRTALRLAGARGGAPGGASCRAQGDRPDREQRAAAARPGLRAPHLQRASSAKSSSPSAKSAGGDLIKKAQALGKELFGQQGRAAEEPLFVFLKEQLSAWSSDLREYEPLAKTGKYPGSERNPGRAADPAQVRRRAELPAILETLRGEQGTSCSSSQKTSTT